MLILIRHGQSQNNASEERLRVSDPGLTAMGIQQSSQTAKRLAQLPVSSLYCSPFLRSLETTRPIADATKLPVNIHAEIFEQGGCYNGYEAVGRRGAPGMGAAQLREHYPGWRVDPSIPDSGWWNRDYETLEEATHRAEQVAEWMGQLPVGPGLHVFVIHADFKRLLIDALSRSRIAWSEPIYNASITHFDRDGESWQLRRLNCVEHLDGSLVSPQPN